MILRQLVELFQGLIVVLLHLYLVKRTDSFPKLFAVKDVLEINQVVIVRLKEVLLIIRNLVLVLLHLISMSSCHS